MAEIPLSQILSNSHKNGTSHWIWNQDINGITEPYHWHCFMQWCVMAISHAIYFDEREKVGSVLFLEKIGVRQNTKINWEQLPDLVDMGVNSSVSC